MQKIDRLGWVVQDNYRIGEKVVGVRYTNVAFADLARAVLAPLETDEDADPKLSVVADGCAESSGPMRSFNILYRGGERSVRTLSARRLMAGLMRELARYAAKTRDDTLFIEGIAVGFDGASILLPPWSGKDRDALAKKLGTRGLAVADGSLVAMRRDTAEIIPLPPVAEVTEETYDQLASIAPEPTRTEHGVAELPGPRRLVAAVAWAPTPATPVKEMSRAMMVHALANRTTNRAAIKAPILVTLAKALEGVPCYAVGRGEGSGDILSELLSETAGYA